MIKNLFGFKESFQELGAILKEAIIAIITFPIQVFIVIIISVNLLLYYSIYLLLLTLDKFYNTLNKLKEKIIILNKLISEKIEKLRQNRR
jgi:hypothetical protein